MPDISHIANRHIDLSAAMPRESGWLMMEGDRLADTLRVTLTNGGEAVSLEGVYAAAYVDRADGVTILCPGAVEGNVITIPLSAHAYAVPGSVRIRVALTVGESQTTRTILTASAYVERAGSGVVLEPAASLPTIEDIAAVLAQMLDSDAAAVAAATAANEAAAAATSAATAATETAAAAATAATETAAAAATAATGTADAAAQRLDDAVAALPGQIAGMFSDLGLVVVDGKLCVQVERE